MFRKHGFKILMVLIVLSGCSKGAIDMTPLQKAELDLHAYINALRTLKEKGQLDNLAARDRIQTKYLGVSNELEMTLIGIYSHEYGEEFGKDARIGMGIGIRPIFTEYLRIRYTYPEKTERELREIYRQSVKRGEVKASMEGKHWKWNPEDDKEDDK